jgi:uncharacterized protein YodC (DUF2158 family)
MKTKDLKEGTLVKLKSGSPAMTVNKIYKKTERVDCVWFADGNYPNIFPFHADALEIHTPSPEKG